MRRLLPLLTTVAAVATATVATIAISGSASAASFGKYVALGDSYAAVGSLDAAPCAGPEPVQMTQPQGVTGGDNPPQFDALTPDTSLVTLTISGNDIGFTDIAKTCAEKSFSNPFGSPCKNHFTEGGTDQLAERINGVAGAVSAALAGIHERAPQATVVLVGYLRILPPEG